MKLDVRLGKLARGCAVAGLALLAGVGLTASQAFTSGRVVKASTYLSLDKVPPGSAFRLAVAVDIEEGWHINAHKPSFEYLIATAITFDTAGIEGFELGEPVYPEPEEKAFSFTQGKTLRVYESRALIGLEVTAGRGLQSGMRRIEATLTVQACNDNSCLAPAKVPVSFEIPVAGPDEPINATHPDIFSAITFTSSGAFPGQGVGADEAEANTVDRWVEERGWLTAVALIFLGGLALNLTPCVYPLIPITMAYFGGQGAGRASRTFSLAAVYVLGMCITYSALGVLAASTGSILGSVLQSPLALIFVAVVLVALGLSMMGLYDIQVPMAIRSRIMSKPGMGGALFMGLTVGLVAAPCVGPFVVSLLAFVGRSGNPLLGFWLFFVLALGLGLPYLFLGGFSGAASGLPRAGAWMVWVKKVFGCIMFAMAFYFLNPLLPDAISPYTIPVTVLVSGIYLGFVEGSPIRTAGFRAARFATATACLAIAAALLMPATASSEAIDWAPFSSEALEQAIGDGQPVIIDFTADWCLPCKELDHFTFDDPGVVEESRRFVTLKADITSQVSESVRKLQQDYRILGAPTLVFIDSSGQERADLRLTGFEKPALFLKRMRQID